MGIEPLTQPFQYLMPASTILWLMKFKLFEVKFVHIIQKTTLSAPN